MVRGREKGEKGRRGDRKWRKVGPTCYVDVTLFESSRVNYISIFRSKKSFIYKWNIEYNIKRFFLHFFPLK